VTAYFLHLVCLRKKLLTVSLFSSFLFTLS
jgi:hypothetical protein